MLSVTIRRAENLQCMERNGRLRTLATAWVDKNNKFPTRVDENGDTNPVWDTTLHIPLERPIDDTTLKIVIFDARNDGNQKRIGSAKLQLSEVKNDVEIRERTLTLKRRSFRSRGHVVVEVLIEKQPKKRKKKKGWRSKELVNALIDGVTIAMGAVSLAQTAEDGEEDEEEDEEEEDGEEEVGKKDGEEEVGKEDGDDR